MTSGSMVNHQYYTLKKWWNEPHSIAWFV